jgi:hypothetical protein
MPRKCITAMPPMSRTYMAHDKRALALLVIDINLIVASLQDD